MVKGSYEFVDIALLKQLEQRLGEREEKVGKMVFKVCRRCGIRKPIFQFTTDKRNTNGRASICKKCRTIESLVYYYENKQKLLIKHKRYRDNHKGVRTKYFQDYQKDHKEHLQKIGKAWYKKNRKRIKKRKLELKTNLITKGGFVLSKDTKEDKDIKIVELCRVFCDEEAVTIKSLLANYNIECILQSDISRSVRPYFIGVLGATEISILVSDRDFEESKEIIKEVKKS